MLNGTGAEAGQVQSVVRALSEDTTLTDRQRASLLEIYAAFQSENAARSGREQDPASEGQAGSVPHRHTAQGKG